MKLKLWSSTILVGWALSTIGCQEKPVDRHPIWRGDADVDPAQDLENLQGKWSCEPDKPDWPPDIHLVIKGNRATITYPKRITAGEPLIEEYRFVLNSSRKPKAIHFYDRRATGKEVHGLSNKLSFHHWYTLEGNTFTLLTSWALDDEGPSQWFKRDNPK